MRILITARVYVFGVAQNPGSQWVNILYIIIYSLFMFEKGTLLYSLYCPLLQCLGSVQYM